LPKRGFECGAGILIIGQGRCGIFEIAGGLYIGGAKIAQPRGGACILREAQRERSKQHLDGPAREFPIAVAAGGEPGIEEHEGNVSRCRTEEKIWPQFRFDNQPEVRAPFIKKLLDPCGVIERRVLMNDVRVLHALGYELCGGDRARGEQHRDVTSQSAKRLDQRQDGDRFANADGMNPHERPLWARAACDTSPLIDAMRVFLSALETCVQDGVDDRSARAGQAGIKLQEHGAGAFACHEFTAARTAGGSAASGAGSTGTFPAARSQA